MKFDLKMKFKSKFFSFIYGVKVEFREPQEIVDFFRIAHQYSCTDALTFIVKLMSSNVNVENAITFYELAKVYYIKHLEVASKEVCFPKKIESNLFW